MVVLVVVLRCLVDNRGEWLYCSDRGEGGRGCGLYGG